MDKQRPRALVTAPVRGPGLDKLRELADLVIDPWIDHQPLRIYNAEQLAERAAAESADILIVETDRCAGPVFEQPFLAVASCRGDPTNVDVPAATFGKDQEDALERAVDALATILDAYIKDGREIPAPSKGKVRVAVPALIEAKIRLYKEMRAAHVTKAELGRRLDWHGPQVDRLLAMTHVSQFDQLEAAFMALSKRLVVDVLDVAPIKKAAALRKPGPQRLATGNRSFHRARLKRM